MLTRLLAVACAGSLLCAGEVAPVAGAAPWSPSFTTQVRGKDRQFVTCQGKTYMLVTADELGGGVGDGQDIAVTGKLRKLQGGKFGLYRVDRLTIETVGDSLTGKLDGDNLHLLGALTAAAGGRTLAVRSAAIAPSDAQLLQERLAGIAEDDWDRRLGVVSWCHDQARVAGNADFWTATADSLLISVVEELGRKAAERKDVALVVRALDLALNQLRDQGLAGRVCSPAWIREAGGAQAEGIARRMRGLGFSLYKDLWLPRAQALEREYEDRIAALPWQDAEGFYRLGRWADENAELLPRARERSWRCYQAGHNADPGHAGIARELGVKAKAKDTVAVSLAGNTPASDFTDSESGLRVSSPAGWRRGQPIGQTATWNDPASDTAYLLVRAVQPPVDLQAQWNVLLEEARARTGYIELGLSDEDHAGRKAKVLRSTWSEGDQQQQRFSAVALVGLGDGLPAAVLEARGLPGEQPALDAILGTCIGSVTKQAVPTGDGKEPVKTPAKAPIQEPVAEPKEPIDPTGN